jgi:hypothetical protein
MAVGVIVAISVATQNHPVAAPGKSSDYGTAFCDSLGDKALAAMRKRAEELNIKGVAVVSYSPGETVQTWNSKMAVVGNLVSGRSETSPGNNLLGIAYTKSSEMAETLKDSGHAGRKPMTGEYGWQGGVAGKVSGGHVFCAFSGGKSEDDVKVSQAGLEVLNAGQ